MGPRPNSIQNSASGNNAHFEPQGAYTSLSQLQQLRYLAKPLSQLGNFAKPQSQAGNHRSQSLSRGMEFEEVRVYQPGDDVRSIDWRVTARTQLTHTKRYRDEKEKPVITLVDQRSTLFFGSQQCFKSVYACYLAALINWSTLKRGDRAGGMVIGTRGIDEARASKSHQAINRWLQLLVDCNRQLSSETHHPEPKLVSALEQLFHTVRKGAEIVMITDGYDLDADAQAWLFRLRRHNQVSLYCLFDPLEKKFPNLGEIAISDGRQKTSLTVDKSSSTAYQQLFTQRRQLLVDLSQKVGIQLTEVDITQSLTDALLKKQPLQPT
ncbi:MAG: hypothetical protein ACJA04_001016 [Cellvibrionaceae bacterium]|jgi:uncharacterized protein (DUF58 family)